MATTQGKIVDIQKRRTKMSSYWIVRLEGHDTGFFDWRNIVQKSGCKVGDTVSIDYIEGEYPRIVNIQIIDEAPAELPDKDLQIARMAALKAAVELYAACSDVEISLDRVLEAAAKFERWITREAGGVADGGDSGNRDAEA